MWTVGSHRFGHWWNESGYVNHSRRLTVSQARYYYYYYYFCNNSIIIIIIIIIICKSTFLLQDKELARDLTRDRLSWQHILRVSWVCAVNLHPSVNKYYVRFPELRHTHERNQWVTCWKSNVSAADVSQGSVVTCLRYARKYNKNLAKIY